jgi:hypothetical protein
VTPELPRPSYAQDILGGRRMLGCSDVTLEHLATTEEPTVLDAAVQANFEEAGSARALGLS